MESETSRSDDTGADAFDCNYDLGEEECGLVDAFKQFEAQAEKRTLKLLKATDEQLFDASQDLTEGKATKEPDYPAYVYMSDQFRLKKAPDFQNWQQNFQYLQVAGSNILKEESMDHIQHAPMKGNGLKEVIDENNNAELQVQGTACLKEPTAASREVYEEIILIDGVMEEILQQNETTDDEEPDRGRFSPHATYVEEVLDILTIECFTSTVAPMLNSLSRTLVEKQKPNFQATREEMESFESTREEHTAFLRAEQLRQEQKFQKDAEEMRQQQFQRVKEPLRVKELQSLLTTEEMKVKEVATRSSTYSLKKEKYGSRRDSQSMPTLCTKKETPVFDNRKRSTPRSDSRRTKLFNVHHLKVRPNWVTGGALTNDKLCDISRKVKTPRFPVVPPLSSTPACQSCRNNNGTSSTQLPILPRFHTTPANLTIQSKKLARKHNAIRTFPKRPPKVFSSDNDCLE